MLGVSSILILEDNPGDVELIRECLDVYIPDAKIYVAETLKAAVEIVYEQEPSLALVDLTLPDAGPADVIRTLTYCDPSLPVIAVSGADITVITQVLAWGAQEAVQKNKVLVDLVPAIERALLRKQADQEIRWRATHDSLTGLVNRIYFGEEMERALSRNRRHSTGCGILYVDLDKFKAVNDTHGHAAGDHVLRTVAQRIEAELRVGDTASRQGGDEIAILVEDVRTREPLTALANRLIHTVTTEITLPSGIPVTLGCSVGITLSLGDGTHAADIIRTADAAMLEAKKLGGRRFVFAGDVVHANEGFSEELERALDREEFHLVYQAKVDLLTEEVIGFEALLRWRRGGGLRASPAEFVPALERTGLIKPVGGWVLRQALQDFAWWRKQGPDREDTTIAVNVSAQQMEVPSFTTMVFDLLREAGLAPPALSLEITETALLRSTPMLATVLRELRDAGVGLELDDFLTGYSSVGYLLQAPPTAIKIDKSFVDLCTQPLGMLVIEGVTKLAHGLKLTVTAEGVETRQQADTLKLIGVENGQGYLWSRPSPLRAETLPFDRRWWDRVSTLGTDDRRR